MVEINKDLVITKLRGATDSGLYQNDEIRPEMQNLIDQAESVGIDPSISRQIISGLSGKYNVGEAQVIVIPPTSISSKKIS